MKSEDLEDLIISPTILTLLTTYKCTAACKNCCFQCNPQRSKRLSRREMVDYIDESLIHYHDSLRVLVLTGGECFLLGNDLIEIIAYGSKKGLIVRVVTNGYWAANYDVAYNTLKDLKDQGLNEINFSTGDDHQEWVPYSNIVHGIKAAIELGLTCAVNIEAHDESSFKAQNLFVDEEIRQYLDRTKYPNALLVSGGVWVPFDRQTSFSYDNITLSKEEMKEGCESLFKTLSINPYSYLFSCCGLTCEYILPLRLGNIRDKSIKDLWESQFFDLLKIWLYVDGPHNILQYIYSKRNIDKTIIGHACYACAEIFKDEDNIKCIKNYYKEILPTVLLKYKMFKKPTP